MKQEKYPVEKIIQILSEAELPEAVLQRYAGSYEVCLWQMEYVVGHLRGGERSIRVSLLTRRGTQGAWE